MDVIIPTNLVRVLFDPAIPTSSFNYIVFYTCFCSFLFLFRIIHASIPSDMVFPLTHVVGEDISRQKQLQLTDASQIIVFMHVCKCNPLPLAMRQG